MVALMQNWVVRKPVAASRGGVVASQSGTAAGVGAEVLAAGGTAVDAVVATAFALTALEPAAAIRDDSLRRGELPWQIPPPVI